MECKSRVIFIILFSSLVLFASPIDGRKGPREYWAEMMKDQPIPEAFKGLIGHRPNEANMEEQTESYFKNFDPMPNISVYHDDITEKEMRSQKDCNSHHDGPMSKNLVVDNFEPRPTISVYANVDNFEPRPTISVYAD